MKSQKVKVNFVAKSLFWTMSRVLCVTQTVPVVPCYLLVNVGNQLDYMGSSLSSLHRERKKKLLRSRCFFFLENQIPLILRLYKQSVSLKPPNCLFIVIALLQEQRKQLPVAALIFSILWPKLIKKQTFTFLPNMIFKSCAARKREERYRKDG